MNKLSNPFTETSTDLFTLDTKVIMAKKVMKNMLKAEKIGIKQ